MNIRVLDLQRPNETRALGFTGLKGLGIAWGYSLSPMSCHGSPGFEGHILDLPQEKEKQQGGDERISFQGSL